MNSHRLLLFSILLGLSTNLRAQSGNVANSKIESIIERADAQDFIWSVSVVDVDTKELTGFNSQIFITPASNLKLFTSFALLSALGGDYTVKTKVYVDGRIREGVLEGDLIVRGAGDPGIGADPEDPYRGFKKIVSALNRAGIRQISGEITGDISAFDDELYPKGWDWFDLSFYYATPVSPLVFHQNTVQLTVFADSRGKPPRIEFWPKDQTELTFFNEQTVIEPDKSYKEYYRRDLGTGNVHLRSLLPESYVEKEEFSVANPSGYFVRSLNNYLESEGVNVGGSKVKRTSYNAKELMELTSLPMREMVKQINQKSNNLYAEQLVLHWAHSVYGDSVGFSKGVELVRKELAKHRLDTTKLEMADVSGLSPNSLTTTALISQLLAAALQADFYEEFQNSLGNHGEEGTLKYRFTYQPWKYQFKGKSGYMSGVRLISGYLLTNSGKRLCVSIACNHYNVKTAVIDRVQEEIITYLYETY